MPTCPRGPTRARACATCSMRSGLRVGSPPVIRIFATGTTHALADVRLLCPTTPTKVIALWNNFHALAAKLNLADQLARDNKSAEAQAAFQKIVESNPALAASALLPLFLLRHLLT